MASGQCVYTLEDGEWNVWQCSRCDFLWELTSGCPSENDMKFCPHCGREIEREEYPSSDEELGNAFEREDRD